MTLRTYIDRAIRDGADFDAVISGCDVQQTFCWQPDMCIGGLLQPARVPAAVSRRMIR